MEKSELNIGWLLKAAPDLYTALTLAAPEYCSKHCPSVGRMADGPLPHTDKCKQIKAALGMAEYGSKAPNQRSR